MDLEPGSGRSKNSGAHLQVFDRCGSSTHSREHSGSSDDSGNSTYSRKLLEFTDDSGSSTQSRKHSGSTDESGSSEHVKAHSGVTSGSGRNETLDNFSDITDRSESSQHSESYLEIIDSSGISKHLTIHLNATTGEDDKILPAKKLRLSSSSSLTSSIASSSDLFQVNTNEILKSHTFTTAPHTPEEKTRQALKDEFHVSSGKSSVPGEPKSGSPGPTSTCQVSVVTHESIRPGASPTQSPAIQVMDRSGRYDPFRIPSSVFERSKSSGMMDWSAASNESLFSLHIGNNSFSRDHIAYSELLKSGDAERTKSHELIAFSTLPPVPVVNAELETIGQGVSGHEDATVATIEDESGKPSHPQVSWSSNVSNHSDGLGISSYSICCRKKCAWPSCYCCSCSWALCYYTWPSCCCWWPNCCCKQPSCCCGWPGCGWGWPSCCCGWPSCSWRLPGCCCRWPSCYCSNCSWAFCYCWNCGRETFCYPLSPILVEDVKSPVKADVDEEQNLKPDVDEEQSQKPASEATSNSSPNNCYTCVPSCPQCCSCYCC